VGYNLGVVISLINKMNDQTNTPQDMWQDDEPAQSQSESTNKSTVSADKPKMIRKRKPLVGVVTMIVVAIVVLGAAYAFGKYWPNIQSWLNRNDQQTEQTGPIAWQTIQPISSLGMMKSADSEAAIPGYNSSGSSESLARYYKVGKFVDGQYKDSELILADLVLGGMGPSTGVFRVVKKPDGDLVVIGRQSPDLSDWMDSEDMMIDTNKFTIDNSYLISDLEMPDKITNSADSHQIIYRQSAGTFKVSDAQIVKNSWSMQPDKWIEAFTNPVNNLPIWTHPKPSKVPSAPTGSGTEDSYQNGFYVQLADGTFLTYALQPVFLSASQQAGYFSGDGVPGVSWTDTGKEIWNEDEYSMATVGGCGTTNYAAVMPDSLASKLQVIGKTGEYGPSSVEPVSGEPIYGFKDTNEQLLKDLYKTYTEWNQAMSDQVMTYQQFLATHPLFFWKDPFGRLIKFTRKDILPAAECGKPVIYLYPEKTTRVSVKVSPVGGFSFTDPDYGTGWDVIARPDGLLTEVKSQKIYPYLFWEGRGGLYQSPAKGWVVTQAEVSGFLDDKLAQLGLNDKEAADFKEFWLPRMQSAPYYFVGFWDNAVMNQIAPLSITPKPDTVVRILMDFKPLQQPIEATQPTIKTPVRRGFTVIEWGGVIQ